MTFQVSGLFQSLGSFTVLSRKKKHCNLDFKTKSYKFLAPNDKNTFIAYTKYLLYFKSTNMISLSLISYKIVLCAHNTTRSHTQGVTVKIFNSSSHLHDRLLKKQGICNTEKIWVYRFLAKQSCVNQQCI